MGVADRAVPRRCRRGRARRPDRRRRHVRRRRRTRRRRTSSRHPTCTARPSSVDTSPASPYAAPCTTAGRPRRRSVMSEEIEIVVNGERRRATAEVRVTLADFLRDKLGLTGTHLGCEHGVCGACTVIVDGVVGAVVPHARGAGAGQGRAHRRGPRRPRRPAPVAAGDCASATRSSAASARRAS